MFIATSDPARRRPHRTNGGKRRCWRVEEVVGAPLPTEVPPICVQVPFLPHPPDLAVSWAHFSFPEQQETSQTQPVNSQGVPLSGVVPAVCYSACVGCSRWIPAQKDAKTRFLAPWHPTVAATNNLMTDLYLTNEMSSFWPGLGPWFGSVIWCHCT